MNDPGPAHGFRWMDLKVTDPAGAAAFLSPALGWEFAVDETDWRRATVISVGGHRIGGVSDLSHPVYPPGTPAHVAYYLAVDDVDRCAGTATAHGARVVVEPFDAGDRGRVATLVDPQGAAFSLWRPRVPDGWGGLPPGLAGAPHHMVLACERPDEAREFYRRTTGSAPRAAAFVTSRAPGAEPRWELAVAVDALDALVARVRRDGRGDVTRLPGGERPPEAVLRGPEGLTFRVCGPGLSARGECTG
ncbi:hypothetical protein SAMN06297387_106176 [Streptomyces zhaozhouensis]|uniref:VOC domain-containing protein n=1 Tax=Streptomyces zhaozhouensis TaxID=1300267 RepID=A0A286DV91_9ACTN|nr:VOC family protein [Streptomyces zhaozhouensis]SOD62599.1 hypothetical protein SAMN06297387_106176 [Streptomyces zhaozhouensis]